MFGMSSTEFWEEEPQLYWAYRFSYLKKLELEQKRKENEFKMEIWSQGMVNTIATGVAINNSLNKKKLTYPTYKEFWEGALDNTPTELKELLDGVEDIDERGNIEFNYWARA